MNGLRVGSLFSGIGGLDLGLERAGFRVVWQCESDPYARAVLRKHWPNVPCYDDVRILDGSEPAIDLLCGGFPCQPVSVAGKRLAQADPRWLWPAFAAVVALHRPALVLVENVPGLRTAGLRDVLADLAGLGFDAEWGHYSAADVGAPHLRRRLFIVAYAQRIAGLARGLGDADESARGRDVGGSGERADVRDPDYEGEPALSVDGESGSRLSQFHRWAPEPDVGRVADGIPARVDRLRCLGNAVVPQVAEAIGHRLMSVLHG